MDGEGRGGGAGRRRNSNFDVDPNSLPFPYAHTFMHHHFPNRLWSLSRRWLLRKTKTNAELGWRKCGKDKDCEFHDRSLDIETIISEREKTRLGRTYI